MIYETLFQNRQDKKIAVLIDPDKGDEKSLLKTLEICKKCRTNFIMAGGSLVSAPIDNFIKKIKENTSLPVVLFPGNLLQISEKADAILLLMLISGRNPEYLIGNHVIAAPFLKRSKLEIISTGYMLIDCGKTTSVHYISNTLPIPCDKIDLAIATAIAGEMLGLKLLYLETGSGAIQTVPELMISEVRKNTSIPIMVGGGIKNGNQIEKIFKAGADIVVIGNSLENNPNNLFNLLKTN